MKLALLFGCVWGHGQQVIPAAPAAPAVPVAPYRPYPPAPPVYRPRPAPQRRPNNWGNWILPYYLAKKVDYKKPTINWPTLNFNPIQAADKTFIKDDILPAVMAGHAEDTPMEFANWYYYMKKNHAADLTAIKNLVPLVMMESMIEDAEEVQPFVRGPPVNYMPNNYGGNSFQQFENLGNGDTFFNGDDAGYPGANGFN